jgi:H+/Cl- antiporter ClcA
MMRRTMESDDTTGHAEAERPADAIGEMSIDRHSIAAVALFAIPLGAVVALGTLAYLLLYAGGVDLVWDTVVPSLPVPPAVATIAVATLGGAIVGLILSRFGAFHHRSLQDELTADGRVESRGLFAMLSAAVVGLASGASLGPEAPLGHFGGAVGTKAAEWVRWPVERVRVMALSGISGVFGGYLGIPLVGGFLSFEFTGLTNFAFYPHLVAATVASVAGFLTIFWISGVRLEGLLDVGTIDGLAPEYFLEALALGLIGVGLAALFRVIFGSVRRAVAPLAERAVLRPTVGGLAFGVIGAALPLTLFSGEHEIETLLASPPDASILILLAVVKLLTLSICLATGFPGGFLFPLFFAASCVGLAVSDLLPGIPVAVAVPCTIAAAGGAVMRMPFAILIITGVLTSVDLLPILLVSALTGYILALPIADGGAREAMMRSEASTA